MKTRIAKLSILLISSLIWSCGSSSAGKKAPEQTTASYCKERMSSVKENLSARKFITARTHLNKIQQECSGSGFLEESQFLMGMSYFNQELWIEAQGEFTIFVDQFHSSPMAPMAAYMKGLAAAKQPWVLGRDEPYTKDAINSFSEYLVRFPEHAKVDSARIHLFELQERLALSDFKVADLYIRMDEYLAASVYLKEFLVNYPQSRMRPKAMEMIITSYLEIKQFSQAKHYLGVLEGESKRKGMEKLVPLAQKLGKAIQSAEKSFEENQEDKREITKQRAEDRS